MSSQHWIFGGAQTSVLSDRGCVAYRGYFKEKSALQLRCLPRLAHAASTDGGWRARNTRHWGSRRSGAQHHDAATATAVGRHLFNELGPSAAVREKTIHEFNEAFATTVEDAGLERWLARGVILNLHAGIPRREHKERAFIELFRTTRAQLMQLYTSGSAPQELRQQKAAVFGRAAGRFVRCKPNRAITTMIRVEGRTQSTHLASVATTISVVPGFGACWPSRGVICTFLLPRPASFRSSHVPSGHARYVSAAARAERMDLSQVGR